jgi:arsenite-transporting ATPase
MVLRSERRPRGRRPSNGRRSEGGASGRSSETPPKKEVARFRFFGGKGGVGKTTCAAAAAVAAAERGRRVLLVSTDPAHSLGDALDRRLSGRPSRVPTRAGRLGAVELDAERALARWLRARRGALHAIASRGTYLDDEDIERLLRLSLPGVDELIGLLELTRLAADGRYHDVVVDTAPTGHTLRLLAMPETVRRIAAVLDDMYAKHRFVAERFAGGYRPDASDAVIEELEEEGRALAELLRDATRCAFTWVLLPEPLAVEEAADGVGTLEGRGLAVGELIVNRVTGPPRGPCAICPPRRHAERAAIAAARRRFHGRRLRLVPRTDAEPCGVGALRAIGRALARPPAGMADGPASPLLPRRDGGAARPEAAGPGWLDVVAPPGTRLLLVAGKGGVGKTTCAATIALALAARRPARPVLLLSTDPAHSLGDVLGRSLGDEPRTLPGAAPALRARELDAEAGFHARRARYRAAVDELFDVVRPGGVADVAFDRAVVQDLIDLAPPGVDELFAVLAVGEALAEDAARPPGYDTVVVDTAPTGHTLRLLALPAVALGWTQALLAILLKYRAVVRAGTLAEELVALSRELRRLERLLHDERATRVLVITRAGAVVRAETTRLLDRLRGLRLGVAAVVLNGVTPERKPRCRRCTRDHEADRRQLAALRASRARRGAPVLVAPVVVPPPRGVPALARWGRTWSRA